MPLPFQRRGGAQLRPTFSRDFAGLKTLDHGTGPAITFTRASNATFFDTSGVLQTASNNQPRFDHDPATGASRGLLIEEARTNSIRNSQAGGSTNGVIGVTGIAPNNWQTSVPTGITREIIGTGTLNGFSYIDIKFSGTNTSGSSGSFLVGFDTTTQIVAANGQTWTGSVYIALVGGSFSGATGPAVDLVERSVGGSYLAGTQTNIAAATGTLARFSATRTFNQATTERTTVQVAATVPSGNTVDITLRIAAPQLEQGAFPTSYIPTTTAAATRSADSAVVTPISGFYNQSEGTLFAEYRLGLDTTASRALTFNASDSNNNDEITVVSSASGNGAIAIGRVSNSQVFAVPSSAAIAANTTYKIAAAFKNGDQAGSRDGASVGTATAATIPSSLAYLFIGNTTAASANSLNGHIRKIAYYPKRLSNTLLQQLTT